MQTSPENHSLEKFAFILYLFSISLGFGCEKKDAFEIALSKSRKTLIDQVNEITSETPYYSTEALNPIDVPTAQTKVVEIPPFKLLDQAGKERTEAMFKGKVSVVGFVFTSCNGFCPFVLEGMKKIARKTDADIQFVAFSVDPEYDTPERLREYAKTRGLDDKRWTLLTGDKETLMAIAKETFSSQTFQKPTVERDFIHSEHLYIIDEEGKLRGILNGTRTDVADDGPAMIGKLLPKEKVTSVE